MIKIAKSKWESHVRDRLVEIEAWARNGLTDEQIAKNLDLSIRTFYEYKNKYPQFSQSLKRTKAIADIEVENALYKRAVGYEIVEETTQIKEVNGVKTTHMKKVKKHIAGDVVAQIFWLKNRKCKDWKDRPDEEFDNNINITIKGI